MLELESAMYEKVRQFMVDHWHASASLAGKDAGGKHDAKGISLSLGGFRVEPDVFGIVARDGVEVPILGEGKRRMGGHSGTEAFAQALTYRNLGMLAFVFFPEAEFSGDATPMMRAMCNQAGIGLLRVPSGRQQLHAKVHIEVDLAGR